MLFPPMTAHVRSELYCKWNWVSCNIIDCFALHKLRLTACTHKIKCDTWPANGHMAHVRSELYCKWNWVSCNIIDCFALHKLRLTACTHKIKCDTWPANGLLIDEYNKMSGFF